MKEFRSRLTAASAAALLLMLSATASATVARYIDLYEHVELSSLVVRAITGSETRSFVGEDGIPRTERKFHLLEVYKGSAREGDTVWLRQFGGGTELVLLPIPGDARFTAGEEVVLFLRTNDEGTAFLTAMGQSKFVVARDERHPVVNRKLGDLAFYGNAPSPGIYSVPDDGPVALELFEETLRELAATTP